MQNNEPTPRTAEVGLANAHDALHGGAPPRIRGAHEVDARRKRLPRGIVPAPVPAVRRGRRCGDAAAARIEHLETHAAGRPDHVTRVAPPAGFGATCSWNGCRRAADGSTPVAADGSPIRRKLRAWFGISTHGLVISSREKSGPMPAAKSAFSFPLRVRV